MLLVVTYSRAARRSLRNAVRTHEECVVRRLGRAALFEETELGAFLSLKLRAEHGLDVQIERTRPLEPSEDVPEAVRTAATAYADREHPSTPYAKFAVGTPHPGISEMRNEEL